VSSFVEFNGGIPKIRLELSDLVSVFKDLANAAIGANERENARITIKAMIEEAGKSYATVVRTLTPLYDVKNVQQLADQFGNIYKSFKEEYLNRESAVRTSCHIISKQFDLLNERRRWMEKLPFANRVFLRLSKICKNWLAVDAVIIPKMELFYGTLNGLLDGIDDLNRADPANAFQALRGALRSVEGDFLETRRLLGELEAVGEGL
jgi:hypothetical protein